MSLFNNVANSLSGGGLTGAINGGIKSASGSVSSAVSSALGGGRLANTVGGMAGDMAGTAARNKINGLIPLKARSSLNAGFGALGDLARGDYEGAGLRLLQAGALDSLLGGSGNAASRAIYWGTPTPLMGGISPANAKQIYELAQAEQRAKKNLFLIEVTSNIDGDAISDKFNMFVIGLDYTPYTMSGDRRKIGGTSVDCVQGSEHAELSFTTYDDQDGSLKNWFSNHHSAAAHQDGTVGVPADYAIKFKIVHAFITRASSRGGYEDIGYFRANNLETSLSRSEDGLQELQMSFTQIDAFVRV